MNNKGCVELENIKYKSMLLNGNFNNITNELHETNISNIDEYLEKEKQLNKEEHWNKLDKTLKLQKLKKFVELYSKEHNLNAKENKNLLTFLTTSLDHKKLLKSKDVVYDKATGNIKSIPCLLFNTTQRKFTLKRNDKRQSTLKSLAPKRNKTTKDNKSRDNKSRDNKSKENKKSDKSNNTDKGNNSDKEE
jgi:hypothetical protein